MGDDARRVDIADLDLSDVEEVRGGADTREGVQLTERSEKLSRLMGQLTQLMKTSHKTAMTAIQSIAR